LEYSIGITIFERSSGGVRATHAGSHFIRVASSILEQLDALVSTTQATGRGEVGRLVIGLCTSLSTGNLRSVLLDFNQRLPKVELETVERSRARLITALRNGVLDILIVTGSMPLVESKRMPLWSERILVVLPNDHSLTLKDYIFWTDLRGETVLLSTYDPGRELEDLLVSKLVSPEDRPKIKRHDVSRGIIKSLVSMKTGISLVLESDIGANFAGLEYRELRDGTGPSRFDYSAYWREDNESPALDAFLKTLSERYPSSRLAR
jgi:DNA-binding transcriptional LysR family regulator